MHISIRTLAIAAGLVAVTMTALAPSRSSVSSHPGGITFFGRPIPTPQPVFGGSREGGPPAQPGCAAR